MSETVFFQNEAASLLVSDARLQIWSQSLDVRGIDDFDLISKSAWRELSTIFNPVALLRPRVYTIELIGPLGKKRLFEANMGVPNEVRTLRSIVMGLCQAIALREAPSNNPQIPIPTKLESANLMDLPRSLRQAESLIFQVFQEPDDSLDALQARFAEAISVRLGTKELIGVNHLATIKVIYEAKRLASFGDSRLTAGKVFRPIAPNELTAFNAEISRQLS